MLYPVGPVSEITHRRLRTVFCNAVPANDTAKIVKRFGGVIGYDCIICGKPGTVLTKRVVIRESQGLKIRVNIHTYRSMKNVMVRSMLFFQG